MTTTNFTRTLGDKIMMILLSEIDTIVNSDWFLFNVFVDLCICDFVSVPFKTLAILSAMRNDIFITFL